MYGYQDIKLRGEMIVEAELNVVADELVGQYEDELGTYQPITHMYSSAPAVLEINGVLTTSKSDITSPKHIQS